MSKSSSEGQKYKPIGSGRFHEMLAKDIERNIEKFNDPVVLGELLYKLLEERESTNRLFKTLIEKLDRLERKLVEVEERTNMRYAERSTVIERAELLPEVDRKIIDFVKSKGYTTAEDVRRRFRYKGKNAASARLNRLYAQGLLTKKQVGRKVYYMVH